MCGEENPRLNKDPGRQDRHFEIDGTGVGDRGLASERAVREYLDFVLACAFGYRHSDMHIFNVDIPVPVDDLPVEFRRVAVFRRRIAKYVFVYEGLFLVIRRGIDLEFGDLSFERQIICERLPTAVQAVVLAAVQAAFHRLAASAFEDEHLLA